MLIDIQSNCVLFLECILLENLCNYHTLRATTTHKYIRAFLRICTHISLRSGSTFLCLVNWSNKIPPSLAFFVSFESIRLRKSILSVNETLLCIKVSNDVFTDSDSISGIVRLSKVLVH